MRRLWIVLVLLAGCSGHQRVADFGVGTERITQVGGFMLRWGHETFAYRTNPRGGQPIKEPTGFQPHEQIVYAGVLSGSIVIDHASFRPVTSGNQTVWILANQQRTYHPLSSKEIIVGTVVMGIKKADGKSIHFVVRRIDADTSLTVEGPNKVVAEPSGK